MRYLIVSDIHGDAESTKFICDKFTNGQFDKMLLLGDVLYHGPRNDLPKGYAPKECIKLLNAISDKIIWIRGNCDAYVDEMVLNFKVSDYLDLNLNGIISHLEHGHFLDKYNGNPDLVLYGHTHIPECDLHGKTLYCNPGSISIPKNNTKKSYAILEDKHIQILDMEDNIISDFVF
ncbi:MAG: phosphodiesterase [Acholeplasmatales bacterium]|nr:phosphodiesterase [Acholeplasmatales bacterium]